MKKYLALTSLLFAFGAVMNAGTISYNVFVDTSSIAGQTGYIDLQFNGDLGGTPLTATATITGFSSIGFTYDDSSNFLSTGVSGGFDASPLVIPNDPTFASNEFAQGVTAFGNNFSFLLTISGSAIGGTSDVGSEFYTTLQDTSLSPLIGGSDLGSVASILINANGTVTPQTTADSALSQTPEPGTLLTFAFSGFALVAVRLRTARSR